MSRRVSGLTRRATLDVPAERAFAAFGTLAGVRGFWTAAARGSTRTGGELTLCFRGLDEKIRYRIEECEAPSHARWLCLGHDSLPEWAGTRLLFTVRPRRQGGCSLELVHEGLVPSLACYESCRAGWVHFFDSLVAWVQTGRGEPYGGPSDRRAKSEPRAARRPARKSKADDAAYLTLARSLKRDARVTQPKGARGMFGANALKVDGKIFAMWMDRALVVKLSAADIDAAIEAGHGERLKIGRARVMKEWLVVRHDEAHWPELAQRARAFVGGSR